jgi:hypothetical protein
VAHHTKAHDNVTAAVNSQTQAMPQAAGAAAGAQQAAPAGGIMGMFASLLSTRVVAVSAQDMATALLYKFKIEEAYAAQAAQQAAQGQQQVDDPTGQTTAGAGADGQTQAQTGQQYVGGTGTPAAAATNTGSTGAQQQQPGPVVIDNSLGAASTQQQAPVGGTDASSAGTTPPGATTPSKPAPQVISVNNPFVSGSASSSGSGSDSSNQGSVDPYSTGGLVFVTPGMTAPNSSSSAYTDSPPASSGTPGAAAAPASSTPTAATSIAPRTANDYWTKHIAQFHGKYLPDGPSMRPNCGPASVTMALRMIGLDIPGYSGQNTEGVLDKARIMGTGTNNTQVGTTDSELERIIEGSGGRWSESSNLSEMLGWAKQGIPIVLSGNPSQAWNKRYSNDQVYQFDGGHWVTLSGYDPSTGYYIVNDPLSQIGPIYVSEAELQTYNSSHGGIGIAVFR